MQGYVKAPYVCKGSVPITFGGVVTVLGAVAVVACYVPSASTVRTNPIGACVAQVALLSAAILVKRLRYPVGDVRNVCRK